MTFGIKASSVSVLALAFTGNGILIRMNSSEVRELIFYRARSSMASDGLEVDPVLSICPRDVQIPGSGLGSSSRSPILEFNRQL
jgi:hypothetical protein